MTKTRTFLLLPTLPQAAARVFSSEVPYHSNPIPLDKNGGLMEFTVVYTDRAINHMSTTFQKVMNDVSDMMNEVREAPDCRGSIPSLYLLFFWPGP